MTNPYDRYYLTDNLFGDPYPELIEFFAEYPEKGKVLDLGCGQGRNAIALARLGYSVTGIDNSKVGIDQMNHIGKDEKLNVIGKVDDIYTFDCYGEFDIILLDSMFHFAKKDKVKEIGLITKITSDIKKGSIVVVCIQDSGNKVQILKEVIDLEKRHVILTEKKFQYTFEDKASGHTSAADYRMIVFKK